MSGRNRESRAIERAAWYKSGDSFKELPRGILLLSWTLFFSECDPIASPLSYCADRRGCRLIGGHDINVIKFFFMIERFSSDTLFCTSASEHFLPKPAARTGPLRNTFYRGISPRGFSEEDNFEKYTVRNFEQMQIQNYSLFFENGLF